MSDFKLPELPSDDELGITDEDRRKYGDDLPDDGPELSAEEMAALLGEAPPPERKRKRWGRKSADPSPPTGEDAEAPADGAPERPSPVLDVPGPRSRWRGPLTLAALLAIAVVASTRVGLPRPAPANAPDTAFSSARAMTLLVDIARRPHPVGSPEHARVRGLLVDRLEDLGLETQVQTATTLAQVPGAARAATIRNVVGRLPGTASTGAVLVAAHYDSRELAPGAADDGAGVVTILEAVRALQAAGPTRNDVIVLLTDAEEPCLCGAKAFVDQHPWIDDVAVVLNFEMRGAGGPSIMFETHEQNGWIIDALGQADPPPYANSLAYEVYRRMPNNTDFTEFRRAGKQGLNFAALDRAPVYHQAADRVENLSEATLQYHGLEALSMLRYLGDADLGSVDAPDATYVTVPLLGLVAYPGSWTVPISGALLALALIAWLVARAGGARVSGIVAGLGVAVLGSALSFGPALWMRSRVTGFYAEAGSLSGSVLHREGWWVLAAAASTFAVVVTLYAVSRRWLTATELSLGALIVPLLGAVVVSFYAPLGALNLQWPVAAAVLAVVVVGLLGRRAGGGVGTAVTLALAAPVLLILVPVIELVWLAMTARLIAPLAVLIALTLHLCLPALESLRHPNSWWAPVTGLAVAAAAFGMAVLSARPSAERPAPSTLVYAYEHGTASALWATDPSADSALDARAIEWAEERAGSSFARTRDMTDFGLPPGPTPVTDARLVDVPPPTVLVQRDTVEGPVRNVTLTVHSNVGAEGLRFQLDSASGTQLLSINGAAIDRPAALEWAEHYGEPEGDGVRLDLRMPAAQPIGLFVVEYYFRPRELLGPAPFERPADLMPDVSAMSDRAVFRYSVAAYADPRHAFAPGAAAPGAAAVPADPAPPVPEADSAAPVENGPAGPAPDSASAGMEPAAAMPDTSAAPAPRDSGTVTPIRDPGVTR